MKIRTLYVFLLSAILFPLLAACSSDDGGDSRIDIDGSSTVELPAVVNQSSTLSFTTDEGWRASCSASWLTLAPTNGSAGSNTITLTTTETNRTKSSRTVTLTLTSGVATKKVTVRQRGDYAVFDQEEFSLPAEGGVINIHFTTNIGQDQLMVYSSMGLDEWLDVEDESRRTRTDYEGWLKPLRVKANTSRNAREGAFFLTMDDSDGNPMGLDTLWIHQAGTTSGYVSEDYSADGQVRQLCEHTTGRGIAFVLMGDGFQDTDIADGTYDRVMDRALDNLFSEEPIKSMKEYFDVYSVATVSANDQFGDGYSTALSCVPSHQSTGISVDENRVKQYLGNIDGLTLENTLAVVIVNSSQHKGVTYLYTSPDGTRPVNFSIALCAVIDDLESETFRQVLVHEAVGHGFAKLADEYVNSLYGSATEADKTNIRWLHGYDWLLNVDVEADSTRVIWSSFIMDARYATERIGVFEGGDTFFKGVYRPTEGSMMNQNDSPFNAPSRRAIYSKTILLATGKEPTYEDFVAFDEAHKPTVWSYTDGGAATRGTTWSRYLRERKNSCISWRHSFWSTPPTH